ncbi:MAG TPA: Na+/H+ antiporter NhaA, partial [Actinomycetes bacterium]|nr:Na+/H+ antiporter NhaA [Actinomycetes bacterium]
MVGTAWLVTVATRGRVRPPVGWAAVTASGTLAGIGFTVSLLVASLAFHGERLAEAKIGALAAVVVSSVLTWAVYRITATLSTERRARALLGTSEQMLDLVPAVDPARDHVRGPDVASVTV